MRERLAKIERIRSVQARLHRIAEMRLARLDQERTAVRQDEEALVAALNDDDALQGLFIDAMARRLNVLARKTEELNKARIAENALLVEAGLRLKRTERLIGRTGSRHREEERKKAFESLMQELTARHKASFP